MIGKTVIESAHSVVPTPAKPLERPQRRRVRGEVVTFLKETGELVLGWRETKEYWTHKTFVVSDSTEVTCVPLVRNEDARPRVITRRLESLEPGRDVIVDYQTVDGQNLALVICYRT